MSDSTSAGRTASWGVAGRFGFRALVIYFVLYTFPFPLTYIPWLGGQLGQAVDVFWKSLGPWVGEHVLGLGPFMFVGPTGSGDTTLAYVKLVIMLTLSLAGTVAWMRAGRRISAHPRLAKWLTVGVRFYLGVTMLSYGWAKLIPAQFPEPSLNRLLTLYGDSSPMGLLWTFMGFSPVYAAFTGAGEVVGGMLVFLNRTKTLGAAILIAVLSNIVVMNFAYDVPVKLYSVHLLLMAIGIVALDWRRFSSVFFRNQVAEPAEHVPLLASRKGNWVVVGLGVLLVGYVTFQNVQRGAQTYGAFTAGREARPLWGIHDVESFRADGQDVPPLLSDSTRWRALIVDSPLPWSFGDFERPGIVSVWHMDGRIQTHRVDLDVDDQTLTLGDEADVLTWERPAPDELVLRGTWESRTVEIRLRERDLGAWNLTGRGFNWISEIPYNR